MPDIELLLPMGEILGVTVNELLSGRRLDDVEFRKATDENIIALARVNSFSVGERMEFWKAKWIREHVAMIVLVILSMICLLVLGITLDMTIISSLSPIFGIILYAVIHNRMMIYVEGKVFGNGK